jgi:VIT1/CCC1 family predicted Fe2+/Mn2+ transporter
MTFVSAFARLRGSFLDSAGTIVFGMEDGTVSIFGLVFGVAATTSDAKTVLIAGASGAVAAAVSMMAGAYLDAETTRDELAARRTALESGAAPGGAALLQRLSAAGLTQDQSAALAGAVAQDRTALGGLLAALDGGGKSASDPSEQALWMLLADFFAAAVPILPFVFLPIASARVISVVVTTALLVVLGIGRARIANASHLGNMVLTTLKTVAVGIAAALAGVGIGVLIDRTFSG